MNFTLHSVILLDLCPQRGGCGYFGSRVVACLESRELSWSVRESSSVPESLLIWHRACHLVRHGYLQCKLQSPDTVESVIVYNLEDPPLVLEGLPIVLLVGLHNCHLGGDMDTRGAAAFKTQRLIVFEPCTKCLSLAHMFLTTEHQLESNI